MKKLLFTILFVFCGVSLFAQTEADDNVSPKAQETRVTKEFNPYWFGQIEAGAAYTVGEAKFGKLLSPTGALAVGRQFTSVIGARFSVSGWESKGGWKNPEVDYKFNYIAGNIDVMFNMINLICGYKERPFNLNLFVGGGVNYAFNNDKAKELSTTRPFEYLWDDNKISPVGRAGILLGYSITPCLEITLEGNLNCVTDKYNSKNGGRPDFYYNAMLGLSYSFGPKSKVKEIVVAPVVPVAVPAEEKKEPVHKKTAEKPKIVKVEPCKVDVFFELNKYIVNEAEKSKIKELGEYMQKYPESKATICGYSDAKTGTKAYNEKLSKKRAENVAKIITEKYGIQADRITIEYKGSSVQPYSENNKNRVCICIAEKSGQNEPQ